MIGGRDNNDELDWLAFRYIAGELTRAESEAFEQRLARDHAACEAVARAVTLTSAIVAGRGESRPAVVPYASRLRSARWIAAAAAVLLAALTIFVARPRLPLGESSDELTVAGVWAESALAHGEWSPEFGDDTDQGGDDASDIALPDWLIEAVSGPDEAKPDENWEDS
jgi:ferric-dicitrate binding protein FerR (iron transport regulator)